MSQERSIVREFCVFTDIDRLPEIELLALQATQFTKDADFSNYKFLARFALTIPLPPDFDPRQVAIDALNEQKRKLQAEFGMRVTEIDNRINSLLAIELSPTGDDLPF